MITQKVLIVDDEEDICRSVTRILSRKGFSVDTAVSAEDALRLIKMNTFDLVITDLMMPKTDGMELLGIIRNHYPELNVVMITGYASIESAVRAVKLGAAGYLPKPFTPEELMEVTVKALGGRGGRGGRRMQAPPAADPNDPIDVDLPFPAAEVQEATDPAYVGCLDRSDIPRAALYGRNIEARHSVLVVDDEPVVCHSVRRILAKHSCAVEAAFDVDTVMHKMRLNEYDLVILDLKMPKRSGLEVLESIRRQYPGVPVVMISGYGSIEDAVAATQLGAKDFLQKPFTPEELLKVTEEILAS